MLAFLLLLGISAGGSDVLPPPAGDVASRFVRALASGEVEQLAMLATNEAVASADWKELRHLIEKFDCISIPGHAVRVERLEEAELELLVSVEATALARGATRAPLLFPRQWRIVAVRSGDDWKLRSILHEEKVIARRLMALPELDEETFVAAAEGVSLERVVIEFLTDPALYADEEKGYARARLGGTIARKRGMTIAELVSLLEEALVAFHHKKLPRAYEIGERMVAFAEASQIPDARATALLPMGLFEWLSGHFDVALERYGTAAALIDDLDDPRAAMKALHMRAILLSNRGRFREVLTSAVAMGEAAERFGWLEGAFLSAILRTETFTQLQDEQAARHFAVETLRVAERLRNEEFITVSLSNLALTERAAGNAAAAAVLMRRILDRPATASFDHTARAVSHADLAATLVEDHRYAEAEAELRTALRITREKTLEKLLEADFLQALAQLRLREGDPGGALRIAEEADALVREFGANIGLYHRDSAWAIRSTLGSALRAAGRPLEAADALQSAIDLIEAQRSGVGSDEVALSGFMRDKAQPYRELVSLLVDRGRLYDALVVSERFRARALATAVARGHIDRLSSMSEAERKQYDAFHETIADLNRRLLANRNDPANDDIRERLREVRVEQRAFLSSVYAARAEIRHRNLDDPAIVLSSAERVFPRTGEILLSFSIHEEETFAFCVERKGSGLDVSVERIPLKKNELEAQIRRFADQIGRRDLDYRRSARSLYDLLLAPFAARIAGKQLLYVIPDGMLWRLPFQALQRADGKHLVELVALAYTPSLTLLRKDHARGADSHPPSLLAIADPTLGHHTETAARATHRDRDLGPLPDARAEAIEIQRMYGSRSRVLMGSQATETATKDLTPRFDVLHLATHGILDDSAPMYSALVLAGTDADDGLLEAREMIDLDLSADLAILSACESAGGDVTPGEGIIGMSWALMVAGCRSTMVSQWKVDSRSTSALMIAFHRQAAEGEADYASALQRAQRELMRKDEFSHPYYWSPFVLVATSQ